MPALPIVVVAVSANLRLVNFSALLQLPSTSGLGMALVVHPWARRMRQLAMSSSSSVVLPPENAVDDVGKVQREGGGGGGAWFVCAL